MNAFTAISFAQKLTIIDYCQSSHDSDQPTFERFRP
jgi:hypothetical protein